IKEGQTPIMIATANNMSLADLTKLNPQILNKCLIGQQVLINKSQKFLPISTVSTETYSQSVGFDTETVTSNNLYVGMSTTTREGTAGKKAITAKIQRVDGEEIKREIIKEEITVPPIRKIITKGSLPAPEYDTPSYGGPSSNAGLIWPVRGGYISQNFKGSAHTGIDYAYNGNGRGQPIIAAAPGRVVHASYRPSYGNLIKIDHGNGMMTWYAHCLDNSLKVRVGQVVGKGQRIASVGNTGNSYGYHLHFIVTQGGSWQNPLRYLP
ncbi:MAG: peptidoglycan DD-metalloendopeptidase family protein, partial [Oscillospiraceae bacterium]